MNHIGEKHGRLLIIENITTNPRRSRYKCLCDCGKIKEVDYGDLKRPYGGTKSCGCYRRERVTKHGHRNSRIYRIYAGMKSRTNNPNSPEYKNYGGRGIRICEEWEKSFNAFYEWALKNGYSDNLSIDRIDVNGNYEPSNCRWSTSSEQMNNTRRTIFLTYRGQTRPIKEWATRMGVNHATLYARVCVYGWDDEKALTTPIRRRK